MSSKGYLDQYKDPEHTVLKFSLNVGVLSYEAIKIPTTGCPCDHWRRPTVCRLYPLAPRYDLERGFVGVDSTFSLTEIAKNSSESRGHVRSIKCRSTKSRNSLPSR